MQQYIYKLPCLQWQVQGSAGFSFWFLGGFFFTKTAGLSKPTVAKYFEEEVTSQSL